MELKILELSASHAFGVEEIKKTDYYTSVIDQYKLDSTDLSEYNVLLITYFADQEYLYKNKNIIENFLNEGKIVVFCGHLFRQWLPGCSLFMPKRINAYKDYFVKAIPNSPLFNGVEVEDMVCNKGVAGFFARGYYYAPEKAEVCLTFTDGKVISYIDRNTTNGTIIVHAGSNLLGYKNQNKTSDKISVQAFHEPKFAQYIEKLIYLPEFENADLTLFDVLIVPSQINSNLLLKSAQKIREFADSGKIVVALGPQPWEWIPNQKWEYRPTNFWWWLEENADSGLRVKNESHPFFDYFTLDDCTWHQHGVFWPPANTTTLIATKDNGSVLYIDEVSTNGTWIVTTLDPDYHFGSYFMPSAERFLEALFPWLSVGKIKK